MSSCNCVDCNIDTIQAKEYYSVQDRVWNKANITPFNGMLCIGCLEQRLGRSLQPKDFKACPLNRGWVEDKSSRLLNRLDLVVPITKK